MGECLGFEVVTPQQRTTIDLVLPTMKVGVCSNTWSAWRISNGPRTTRYLINRANVLRIRTTSARVLKNITGTDIHEIVEGI